MSKSFYTLHEAYLSVYDNQNDLSEAPFDIYQGSSMVDGVRVGNTGEPVKVNRKPYSNKERAKTRANKLNQEYGANIHIVRPTPENNIQGEAYVPMAGQKLRRVMTKVRDLSSRSQLMKSDPNYRRLAKQQGHSDTDINKKAGELEDRGDKIITRIGKHDPKKAQEREASNRRTINVRATQVNKPRLNEEVDIYDIVLDYLLDEGYCESVENAETMMVHMSEEWVESIVEGFVPLTKEKENRVQDALLKTAREASQDYENRNRAVRSYRRWERLGVPRSLNPGLSRVKRLHAEISPRDKKGLRNPQLAQNAVDAIAHSRADRMAKNISKQNALKARLRELGADD